jgi:hypothetical protein
MNQQYIVPENKSIEHLPSLELSDRLKCIIKTVLDIEDYMCNTISNVKGHKPALLTPDEPNCMLEAIEVIESEVGVLSDLVRDLHNTLR